MESKFVGHTIPKTTYIRLLGKLNIGREEGEEREVNQGKNVLL